MLACESRSTTDVVLSRRGNSRLDDSTLLTSFFSLSAGARSLATASEGFGARRILVDEYVIVGIIAHRSSIERELDESTY